MEFNLDSKPVDPNYFKNEYKFYYLPKEEEWLELIRKRLKHKLTKEKYIYSYKDMTRFKSSLTTKLQVGLICNISVILVRMAYICVPRHFYLKIYH